MTQKREVTQVADPLTQDLLLGALLDITGDLDKAQVLQENLPAWLVQAKPELLRAIEEAHAESRQPRERAARLLKRVVPLERFCAERLSRFLADKGFSSLDIEYDQLEVPRRALSGVGPDLGGALIEAVHLEKHSLLQAAMQNFPAALAEPNGMPRDAHIVVGAKRRRLPTLKAHEFAGYCRELDLGEAYQAHLREVFNLPAPEMSVGTLERGYNPALSDVGRSMCLDMKLNLHIAHGKGDISESTYTLLLEAVRLDRPATEARHMMFHHKPLVWHGLNIGGACLWTVLVLCGDSPAGGLSGPLVVYMPGEPVRVVYEYPSLEDFTTYLTLKLQVGSYRKAFTRYLDESERFNFFTRFDQDRTLALMQPLPVTGNFSAFFFNACVGKTQLDARVLAVPVVQVDEEARRQRLQNYLDVGLTLLNVAGMVVPLLGQLMMGVAVGQLLGEVYEGFEDWRHHQNSEALEHLINVAENIAAMALFAAGVKAVGVIKRTLLPASEFFDGLEAVRLPDNRTRLWRGSLRAYRHSLDLRGTIASPRGLYQVNGQSYVKVDGGLYAIAFDGRAGYWRAQHPQRADAYRPPMIHNNQGGWQFTFERPWQWHDATYLLQRLDPSLRGLPAGHLQEIADITQMSVPRLQQLARQNLPLPERFRDCALRYERKQTVRDLLWQMEHDEALDSATARAQMLALPLLDGWPQGRFFEVLDNEGNLLERYPDTAPFDYEDLSIHITEQELSEGSVIPKVLQALDHEDKRPLVGSVADLREEQEVLTRRLIASLKENQHRVYEALYQSGDVIDQSDHGLLKGHYPQLPIRVAWEVMTQATAAERWQLRSRGRVPLRVAQRAQERVESLHEDHVLMGLYLPELASDATLRVVCGLLPFVEGWPENLMLQIRNQTLDGPLLAQVGNESATLRRMVVKQSAGFRVSEDGATGLGALTQGREGLYHAILDAMPARERAALGLTGADQAGQLRYRIASKAQGQRPRLARYIWPDRPVRQPRLAACAQSVPGEPVRHPAGLVRKVRKLFPLFDDLRVSTFLQALGEDHLSRAKAVRGLQIQYEQLHRALKEWRKEAAWTISLPDGQVNHRLNRFQAMQAIERSWQYATLLADEQSRKVPSLVLDGLTVGPLPTLPAGVSFDHVQQLSLRRMELNDDVAYFLKHFKGLRTLELNDNQLTRLPEVLVQMPHLRHLYLGGNRLQMTEYTRGKLASLSNLRVLNLSDNPLLDPPLVSQLFDLRHLALRDCRLKEVPRGLWRIPHLEQVDLRGNDIADLPGWLYNVPRQLAQVINLRHNPLDLRSRRLLRNYRNSTGVGMGFLEDDLGRLSEQSARELWLADGRESYYSQRTETWSMLRDEPGADGLFKLLSELGGTADTTYIREDMNRRVWRVLEAASGDAGLREEIFARAATPINCDDAAAVSFSNLEVLVEIHEASKAVEGGQVTAGTLLKLARGLFRLDQLERLARRHSDEHPMVDPLEVSLAYRTGLVDSFHLPGQPRHMRFSRLAGVTQQALSDAEVHVRAAELSPDLQKFVIELPFWRHYLKRTYGGSFERLNDPFDTRMQAVFDQSLTLNDTAYRNQMNLILHEQQQAEQLEYARLTQEALRQEGLSLACELPLL